MVQDLLIWTHHAAHMDSGMKPRGADCPLFVPIEEHRRGRIYLSDLVCGECCNIIYRRRADPAPVASSYQPQLCVSSSNLTPSHSLWWLMSTVWKYLFLKLKSFSHTGATACSLPVSYTVYEKAREWLSSHCPWSPHCLPVFPEIEIHSILAKPCLFGTYCTYTADGQQKRGKCWRSSLKSFCVFFFHCDNLSPLEPTTSVRKVKLFTATTQAYRLWVNIYLVYTLY